MFYLFKIRINIITNKSYKKMLRKLDNYHNEIFLTQKDTDFDDLMNKI